MQICVLFAIIQVTLTSKIIMSFTPITSHCLEMAAIGNELLRRGHVVSAYVPDFFDTNHCLQNSQIRVIRYEISDVNRNSYQLAVRAVERNMVTGERGILDVIIEVANAIDLICDGQLSNRDRLDELRKERFDIFITEGLPHTHCYFLVPYYMGVRTAAVSSFIDGFDSGAVYQPYTYPHPIGSYTNEMTALQRVVNSLHYMALYLIAPLLKRPFDATKYGEPFLNFDVQTLIRNASLYLENSDYIADYPRANFPNFIHVGGLTARPADPLPNDLKAYLDNSKTGVVLVSFGTILNTPSSDFTTRILSALNRLPYDVLFKLNRNSQERNVRIVDWLPQNDVLAHPNIRLFVSHCGRNGFFESLYHSVPIVCTPLNADAFQTSIKVKHHRIGTSLNILTCTTEEFVETLTSVLNNSLIRSNMRHLSAIFRDRPETGAERGASAIEHVIKYGDRHLKPTTNRLNFLQYTLCELWFVIFSSAVLIISGVVILCMCITKRVLSVTSVKFAKKVN